ncbi:MAG: hypothetical protein ABIQ77_11690 [Anaerolineales bacterium]
MNSNQIPQPVEKIGIGKRISGLWNSGNRRARLIILAATGLVFFCCCIGIPLSSRDNTLAALSKVGVNPISPSAFDSAQDPYVSTALAIPANTASDQWVTKEEGHDTRKGDLRTGQYQDY